MRIARSGWVVGSALLLFSLPGLLLAQIGNVSQAVDEKPEIVILGSYHMAPTSSNVINVDVDDVTESQRQQQLRDLISRLAAFQPTKIMLECDYEDQALYLDAYREYVLGERELQRSETQQIGFRLASELGHESIYCVDWGVFPDDPLYNYEAYARQHPDLEQYLNGLYADNQRVAEERAEEIASRSIVDNLIELNQPGAIEEAHEWYYRLLRIAREDEYVGANYMSWWYGRNMKIFSNIIRFTESPEDRILVVYGAGHNKLLNQFAQESGFYEVESPLTYLIE